MERFINILIIDPDTTNREGLRVILTGGGNNLIFCDNEAEAQTILRKQTIGIILLNIEIDRKQSFAILNKLSRNKNSQQAYKLVICNDSYSGSELIKGMKKGAVDFISYPFNPNLVKAKIEVFKTLYFKDVRINQLLNNIFPQKVLADLNATGTYTPKRYEKACVLFTDFVAFSKIAKEEKPLNLIKRLATFFSKFDEIVDRYHLEKIKTIGDAYMAIAGVTERLPNPNVRACLAALEMRNFMLNEAALARATNNDYWEIKIGLHSGPLVAGIIGDKKISFDVWGDTVNIASRAEQNATPNSITITQEIATEVEPFFELQPRGLIKIKYSDAIEMFFLENIKIDHSLFAEGKLANRQLRKICGLSEMDFDQARSTILLKLKSSLPETVVYHDIKHTIQVEKAALRLAGLEGIKGKELILLRTAALFHDVGFIFSTKNNEEIAVKIAEKELPKFGYALKQVERVAQLIRATRFGAKPTTLLEKILVDADHDYLGRADYHSIAAKLRKELALQGNNLEDKEWIEFQLDFLKNKHRFLTQTAINLRQKGKEKRISELELELRKMDR